jgi:hypothetical protein
MEMIQRWKVFGDATEYDYGDWVYLQDHLLEIKSLIAERDALAQFAEARRAQINELMDEVESLRKGMEQIAEALEKWQPLDIMPKIMIREIIAEIRRLLTENAELKIKLSAYTEYLPPTEYLRGVARNCQHENDTQARSARYSAEQQVFINWLVRCSSIAEKESEG